MELRAGLVRSRKRGGCHDWILVVVHLVLLLLASRAPGASSISDCLAGSLAVSHRWDRRAWNLRVSESAFFPTGAHPPRTSSDLR